MPLRYSINMQEAKPFLHYIFINYNHHKLVFTLTSIGDGLDAQLTIH